MVEWFSPPPSAAKYIATTSGILGALKRVLLSVLLKAGGLYIV